jgi:hypothetical protein
VAIQTEAHRQILRPNGNSLLRQVAMAFFAANSGANMRRVPESDVLNRIEPVHALPGNVLAFIRVCRKLLDLRFLRRNHLMTRHAEADAGDSSVGPLRRSCMASHALQVFLEMNLVIKCDRLDRRGLQPQIFSQRVEE